jgi:lipopolysaccharide biosynthesis glycosyltransferase
MHDLDNPFIIHFCGDAKPWNDPNLLYADKFWQYARRTPYYETMLLNVLLKGENRDQEIKRCKRKVKQYRILQALTFGAVRSFRRRKKHYRDKIRQLATM